MGWRDVSFQKLPLEIVERKLKHGNEQLILFARLANISLSLVASFSVLTYYYMQGSAAGIVTVAGRCHLLLQVLPCSHYPFQNNYFITVLISPLPRHYSHISSCILSIYYEFSGAHHRITLGCCTLFFCLDYGRGQKNLCLFLVGCGHMPFISWLDVGRTPAGFVPFCMQEGQVLRKELWLLIRLLL